MDPPAHTSRIARTALSAPEQISSLTCCAESLTQAYARAQGLCPGHHIIDARPMAVELVRGYFTPYIVVAKTHDFWTGFVNLFSSRCEERSLAGCEHDNYKKRTGL